MMKIYTFTDKDNRKMWYEGDYPPTQEVIDGINKIKNREWSDATEYNDSIRSMVNDSSFDDLTDAEEIQWLRKAYMYARKHNLSLDDDTIEQLARDIYDGKVEGVSNDERFIDEIDYDSIDTTDDKVDFDHLSDADQIYWFRKADAYMHNRNLKLDADALERLAEDMYNGKVNDTYTLNGNIVSTIKDMDNPFEEE